MLVLVSVALVLLLIFVVDFVSYRLWLYSFVKELPRVPIALLTPLIGSGKKTTVELFQYIDKAFNYNDGLTSFWFGTRLAVLCDDPVNIKTILMSKNCINKPFLNQMMSVAGNGLLSARAHDWHPDRKIMNPTFNLSFLKSIIPIFNRHSADFAKNLQKYVDQPETDIEEDIFDCNFNVLIETIFCCKPITTAWDKTRVTRYHSRLWSIAMIRSIYFWWHPTFIYRFTDMYAEEREMSEFLGQFAQQILLQIKKARAVGAEEGKPSIKLIDKLLEMEQMTSNDRERAIHHLNTFLFAGTDTSSVTMLNTLLLLAMHPIVQDRLYEEVHATVTDSESIDYDTLSQLTYMEQVLKESMRLWPLSFFWGRETDANVKLTECTVPKGTILILCMKKMFHDVNIWGPNATEFDPDRFLPEMMAKRHPFAFLPFSSGPRNCIGYKFAMLSMKVMLCHLVLNYKFATQIKMSDIVFKLEFMMKIDNKYLFEIERR